MLNRKTTQKALFAGLLATILVASRLTAELRIGAIAIRLALLVFTVWMSVRAMEMVTARLWAWAGTLAQMVEGRARGPEALVDVNGGVRQ
jgi:hypothetical protein